MNEIENNSQVGEKTESYLNDFVPALPEYSASLMKSLQRVDSIVGYD